MMNGNRTDLPVAVIGAGPVGLAAAAHLLEWGREPLILEASSQVGQHVREWAHVRMFSPWKLNVDEAARRLLRRHGWEEPHAEHHPSGGDLVRAYLEPLARTPEIRERLRLGASVTSVARRDMDRLKDAGRDASPFLLRAGADHELQVEAAAVVDTSGTWRTPNPLGANGLAVRGEADAHDRIHYRIPDVSGERRSRFLGRRTLVVGSGHSAFNVLHDLAALQREDPRTRVDWLVRATEPHQIFEGGENDPLSEREELKRRVHGLVESGHFRLIPGGRIDGVDSSDRGLVAWNHGHPLEPVDEIVACTGFRPDFRGSSEIRLALDAVTESPWKLATHIDPNIHDCGSVPAHGVDELAHPEPGFYLAGIKSYGRAPNFLLTTGYEAVRSIAAELGGDPVAARRIQRNLPGGVHPCAGPEAQRAPTCCA